MATSKAKAKAKGSKPFGRPDRGVLSANHSMAITAPTHLRDLLDLMATRVRDAEDGKKRAPIEIGDEVRLPPLTTRSLLLRFFLFHGMTCYLRDNPDSELSEILRKTRKEVERASKRGTEELDTETASAMVQCLEAAEIEVAAYLERWA